MAGPGPPAGQPLTADPRTERDLARVDLLETALREHGALELIAEGESMLPTIRSGEAFTVRSVDASTLEPGDIVHVRSGGSTLVHRVLGRLEGRLLTKGDAMLVFDAPIAPADVLGRVTAVGSRDLQRPAWRMLGRILAAVSLAQGRVYAWTMSSPFGKRLGLLKYRYLRRSLLLSANQGLSAFFRRILP